MLGQTKVYKSREGLRFTRQWIPSGSYQIQKAALWTVLSENTAYTFRNTGLMGVVQFFLFYLLFLRRK